MLVFVKTYANLRSIIGEEVLALRMEENSNLEDVLCRLVARYGEQVRRFVSGDRVVFLVNGMTVANMEDLSTKVRNEDLITVLPVLSGG